MPATRYSNLSISVFGIRHHGPGCARSLRGALEALEPDIVLVEGPPDAQNVLPLLSHEEMKPPVALLIYAPDEPKRAAYYPFTYFSPEWQALQYAAQRNIPARFMDLPQAIQLAREPQEQIPQETTEEEANPSSSRENGVGASPGVRPAACNSVHRDTGARQVTPLLRSPGRMESQN